MEWDNVNVRKFRCENCRFWDFIRVQECKGGDFSYGYCRRYPPKENVGGDNESIWVTVESFEWCGEWQPAHVDTALE